MYFEPQWLYNNQTYQPEENHHSFVYVITRLDTNKKYIGKKILKHKHTKPPLKGNKRKRVNIIESDWKTYWGSSEQLLNEINLIGVSMFKREILHICYSKGEASYLETKEILLNDALLYPDKWYNSWVTAKISRSHIKRLIYK